MNRKADFFLQNESIRITNWIESIRIANWNALVARRVWFDQPWCLPPQRHLSHYTHARVCLHQLTAQLSQRQFRGGMFTDHLSGPGTAIGPVCLYVCVRTTFELNGRWPMIYDTLVHLDTKVSHRCMFSDGRKDLGTRSRPTTWPSRPRSRPRTHITVYVRARSLFTGRAVPATLLYSVYLFFQTS